jgi:uncharacterized surface protein with fasciclin (FAS1) repeats
MNNAHCLFACAVAALVGVSSTLAVAQCGGSSKAASIVAASERSSCPQHSGSDGQAVAMIATMGDADIVETAIAAGNFKTLAVALQAAGLVETLKGAGPFTVFAPTDEAFAKLPAGTVENLLKPENRAQLVAVLTYHVVPGRAEAKDVLSRPAWVTVNGQRVDISRKDGRAIVDGAAIATADIKASNGVIHVIDAVLLPSSSNLVQTAKEAKFTTLVKLVEAAGLGTVLSGKDALTVFAPTDEAFAKLPPETLAMLMKPENKAELVKILTFHVVPGRVYSDQAIAAKSAATVQGGRVNIAARDGAVTVNGAKVVKADIDATNGVIHVIDTVMLPQ